MASINGRVWRQGQLLDIDVDPMSLEQYLEDEDCLVWVDLVDPRVSTLDEMAYRLKFSRQSVEDALAPEERPKAKRQNDRMFVQAYKVMMVDRVEPYESRVETHRVSAYIVENGLVTVHGSGFKMDDVIARWDEDRNLVRGGTLGLLHGLLDVIVDGHFSAIQQLDDLMEDIEDHLLADDYSSVEVSRSTYQLRRELVELRRVVGPMRDVVNTVVRYGMTPGWTPQMRAYYDDLTDHVLRAAEWTDSLRDLVSSIFETSLALNDAKLNTVMKKLSGWAAIIAVPTLITGWYGMNVPYPGLEEPSGLYSAVILIIVAVTALFIIFRHNEWI